MFTKTTKALVAALVLTGISLSLAATASATPYRGQWQGEQNYMDRASNGGHHTGDTNGF
jgi:multisubunit Na+/H+ antiporter MnhC subunit